MNTQETIEAIVKTRADALEAKGYPPAQARAKVWKDDPLLATLSRKAAVVERKPAPIGPGTVGDRITKAAERWAVLQQHTNPADYRADTSVIKARLWASELGRQLIELQRSKAAGEQFAKARGGIDPAVCDFLDRWAE